MRKAFAILLLVLFGLPAVSPLFALGHTPEPAVPACCRAGGKHICVRKMAGLIAPDVHPGLSAPGARCPFCPGAIPTGHTDLLGSPTPGLTFATLAGHPATTAQTESKRRIARDRSRQMRGPPQGLSS